MKKEAQKLSEKFRKEHKTEEAARVLSVVEEAKQNLQEWKQMSALDGLISYFYDRTVSFAEYFPEDTLVVLDEPNRLWEEAQAIEGEFRESMANRLEKGYVLPGQMNLLYESQRAAEKLQKYRCMGLCMLEGAGMQWQFAGHFSMDVRSVNTYNNRFELLVKRPAAMEEKGRARDPAVRIENKGKTSGGGSAGSGTSRILFRRSGSYCAGRRDHAGLWQCASWV